MINILQENVSLQPFNTLKLPARARYFLQTDSMEVLMSPEVRDLIKTQGVKVLGGGSNVVILDDIEELVIQWQASEIAKVQETEDVVHYRVEAGLGWHEWVCYCVERGLSGFENLALIPGTVGAAPVQNIGAYGVELAEGLVEVEAINLITREQRRFFRDDCEFGYRESFFKRPDQKSQWLIVAVVLACQKRFVPNTRYPDLSAWFKQTGFDLSLKNVFNAVVEIRQKKLPDPEKQPNVGSFFKNPIVEAAHFEKLKSEFPEIKGFELGNKKIKLAAAQLIEWCGLKGKNVGGFVVSDDHALVIVNIRGGTAEELIELGHHIQQNVSERFGVKLLIEPTIYGTSDPTV